MKAHLVKKRITDKLGRATSVWVKMNDEFNIPREKMPQVRSSKFDDFRKYLKENGVGMDENVWKDSKDLKPTQKHLDHSKVALVAQMDGEAKEKSILVSRDGYILDGHHRWAYEVGRGNKVKANVIDMPIKKLVPFIRKWDGVEFASLNHKTESALAAEKK